eukprot:CAMPEP_0115012328 /NCGR_PEP_ID=MMETSP0216-20121206/24661_1 /TAXON_ID=223996 /ORGANISM="Protocruzia adherens, Strain Boccale" /LENGTH=198 /DNA_ID=CAMNT_0002381343 /DNA_START=1872 /DNA_END=2465 /DNA_ORIENTATION=+
MCFDLDKFCRHRELEEKKQQVQGAEYKWTPYRTSGCVKKSRCHESKTILTGFISSVFKSISSSFKNKKLVQPASLPQRYQDFEEYHRIVKNTELDRETKVGLLDVPDYENVEDFVKMLFRLSKATKEIIVATHIFLNRFLSHTKWGMTATTWRIFVIISLRLAQKYEGFPVLDSEELNFVYKLFSPQEFANLEFEFAE